MRVKALILVPLVAVTLTACAAQVTPAPTSTEAVTEKPLFATDEEALSAAQAAYANYLEVSDQIARDGGANPERLEGLVSPELYKESADVFKSYLSNSSHVDGSTQFDSLHISEITTSSASYYVCLDVSNTRILSSIGMDQTPPDRPSRIPLIFQIQKASNNFTIESSEVWTGRNFC